MRTWESPWSSVTTKGARATGEIDLRYADALSTADNIMTFRTVIKEVANGRASYATFMPKPFPNHPGSAMHTHLSLFEGDSNAFADPSARMGLSTTARQFIAGLLRHAPEMSAITNQWVNSYKRLRLPGMRPRPTVAGATRTDRPSSVPMYKPHKANSTRVEL